MRDVKERNQKWLPSLGLEQLGLPFLRWEVWGRNLIKDEIGMGKSWVSSSLDILNLECLLEIQVEKSSRQLVMSMESWNGDKIFKWVFKAFSLDKSPSEGDCRKRKEVQRQSTVSPVSRAREDTELPLYCQQNTSSHFPPARLQTFCQPNEYEIISLLSFAVFWFQDRTSFHFEKPIFFDYQHISTVLLTRLH